MSQACKTLYKLQSCQEGLFPPGGRGATETQKREVACSGLHSQEGAEQGCVYLLLLPTSHTPLEDMKHSGASAGW